MSERKPLILVTNDDGIRSPGLAAVIEAVQDLGDVLVSAPATQQTSMSRAKPQGPRIGIIEQVAIPVNSSHVVGYAVEGSPSQCVAHAVIELTDRLPDLCVSGANYGENVGGSLSGSGTVGAALEAAGFEIPSIAVSQESPQEYNHAAEYAELDWSAVIHFTRYFAERVLEHGMPDGVEILNLNVPEGATPDTDVRATIQSRQNFYQFIHHKRDDLSVPFRFHEEKRADESSLEPNSDVKAIAIDKVVSVTPLARLLTANVNGWMAHYPD